MYYPKSQITPNLYTNGNEFVLALNNTPYIGFYYKISTGKYFTGMNQDDKPNNELIIPPTFQNLPFNLPQSFPNNQSLNVVNITQETFTYNSLTKNTYINPNLLPPYNPLLPSSQDYQNGEFRRLFCKKSNELQYIEINEETYTKLLAKDPQILWQLYIPFNISWQLTGDKQQVAKTNKNIVELTSKRLQLFRFNEYLKLDYIKYYK
jgi:hypothetical protein